MADVVIVGAASVVAVADRAAGRVAVEQLVTMAAARSTAASGTATAWQRGTGASPGLLSSFARRAWMRGGVVVSR
jgi:hypothetical protein